LSIITIKTIVQLQKAIVLFIANLPKANLHKQ